MATNKIDNLRIRLEEQSRIYRDSPGVTVSYVDLARMNEMLLETISVLKAEDPVGFQNRAAQCQPEQT